MTPRTSCDCGLNWGGEFGGNAGYFGQNVGIIFTLRTRQTRGKTELASPNCGEKTSDNHLQAWQEALQCVLVTHTYAGMHLQKRFCINLKSVIPMFTQL